MFRRSFAISLRNAPEVCPNILPQRGSRECRAHAAPEFSCAMCTRKCAHERTGSAEALRHSLRNGFTAYAVLFPATNSSCHRHCRLEAETIRLDRISHRQLDTSNGCRNHTVLPYASVSFVCALKNRSRGSTRPAILPARPTLPRPPHPAPTFVTMANAPRLGTGWRELCR